MFKIKFSENMAKQLEEPEDSFPLRGEAYMFGIQKYGSGTMDSPLGWTVEEIKQKCSSLTSQEEQHFNDSMIENDTLLKKLSKC